MAEFIKEPLDLLQHLIDQYNAFENERVDDHLDHLKKEMHNIMKDYKIKLKKPLYHYLKTLIVKEEGVPDTATIIFK